MGEQLGHNEGMEPGEDSWVSEFAEKHHLSPEGMDELMRKIQEANQREDWRVQEEPRPNVEG